MQYGWKISQEIFWPFAYMEPTTFKSLPFQKSRTHAIRKLMISFEDIVWDSVRLFRRFLNKDEATSHHLQAEHILHNHWLTKQSCSFAECTFQLLIFRGQSIVFVLTLPPPSFPQLSSPPPSYSQLSLFSRGPFWKMAILVVIIISVIPPHSQLSLFSRVEPL